MKRKYRMLNLNSFLRAVLVGAVSIAVCMLAGALLSEMLNMLYNRYGSTFWYQAFATLSRFRYAIALFVSIAGVALCSRWIFAPAFNRFANLLSDSIQYTDSEVVPVEFPKSMRQTENTVNRINQELQLWKYAMREAEQRKDDLVVYLAHDIRTPLTSVIGYLELLAEHPDLPEEDRIRFTSVALRKAGRMQNLVEDLFEITRFNVGRIELNKTEVNANILFHQLVEEIMPVLENRNITLETDNRGVEYIFADPDKMARVFDNVLHNAAYYTPEGGRIRVVLDRGQHDEHVRIRISNTGSEISQEKLQRFFEKFYRADEARQSGTGGSGLGLAIAKNIVEAHGGTMTADNVDRVTTFTIILSIKTAVS